MELAPGTLVTDNVRLLEPLGAGGMGAVWVAEHIALETRVAVKFMLDDLIADNPDMVARFEREAKAAAQIQSPHVVQVFDHGRTADGRPYMVMELLAGSTLAERLDLEQQLPLGDVARILAQVASALGRAHALGIVHRDIKPDNIFLVDGEDEVFAKLLDFGVAKREGIAAAAAVTAAGMMVGTPSYMSPEQLVSSRDVDGQADQWALGVVAYESLTGRLPFIGETLGALVLAITSSAYAPPSQLDLDLPSDLDAWFARVFHPDQLRRFGDPREQADALLRLARGEGEGRSARGGALQPPSDRNRRAGNDTRQVRAPTAASRFAVADTDPVPGPPPDDVQLDSAALRLSLPTFDEVQGGAPPPGSESPPPGVPPQTHLELYADAPGDGAQSARIASPHRAAVSHHLAPRRSHPSSAPRTPDYQGTLAAAALVALITLMAPFLDPLGRGYLAAQLGDIAYLPYAVVGALMLAAAGKAWARAQGSSTALWLAAAGLGVLAACAAAEAGRFALPGLGLDDFEQPVRVAGGLSGALVALALSAHGLAQARHEHRHPSGHGGYALFLAALSLVGLVATVQLARRPLRALGASRGIERDQGETGLLGDRWFSPVAGIDEPSAWASLGPCGACSPNISRFRGLLGARLAHAAPRRAGSVRKPAVT